MRNLDFMLPHRKKGTLSTVVRSFWYTALTGRARDRYLGTDGQTCHSFWQQPIGKNTSGGSGDLHVMDSEGGLELAEHYGGLSSHREAVSSVELVSNYKSRPAMSTDLYPTRLLAAAV